MQSNDSHANYDLPLQEIPLKSGGSMGVYRCGNIVLRNSSPWTPTIHSLLRHLENVGFTGAPHVVGSGFDSSGREMLTYIEGEFSHPGPWTLEGAAEIGHLLKNLHNATASYITPEDAIWQPWFGRILGSANHTISHCDTASWNIVTRNGLPVALIDWEYAGPVDPIVELAQACWLNAKLFDDMVAEKDELPSLNERSRHLRAIVDGYELASEQRLNFIDRIIEFAICDTAEQADEANITQYSKKFDVDELGFNPLWALAWRARSAAWIVRHRRILQNALL